MQKGQGLEERVPLFAARCVSVCEAIHAKRLKAGHFKDRIPRVRQHESQSDAPAGVLFRCATGVSAKCAEAEEPESRRDFIRKMKAAMKELAESRSWLRIIAACGYLDEKRLTPLIDESLELTRMMGASVATARRKLEQEGDKEI